MQTPTTTFGVYSDGVRPTNFWGMSGWWTVPAGKQWYLMPDSNGQMWASPGPLTKNQDGTVSPAEGYLKYACELGPDYQYCFQEQLANRKLNIDSPAPDRLSPS